MGSHGRPYIGCVGTRRAEDCGLSSISLFAKSLDLPWSPCARKTPTSRTRHDHCRGPSDRSDCSPTCPRRPAVMDSPRIPTRKQEELAALPLTNILVIAPAGCGKTEALALRAAAICARGEVRPPQKVLALTFSNKAKQNLAARMRSIMGPAWWRKVSVIKFHGLAGRVLRAHGDNIGLPQDVIFPERAWLARTKRQLGIDWSNSPEFETALQQAKRDPLSDDEVIERLESSGNRAAVAFEKPRGMGMSGCHRSNCTSSPGW
jgi:hypothetical protein